MPAHHCHAINCFAECKPELLMCPRHWRMVPMPLQQQVYATYRVGQCNDMQPSVQWWIAATAAVLAVAAREQLPRGLVKRELRSWVLAIIGEFKSEDE